jgi:2-C-methyl-D-erythritol 4-phosphate cytidylyltransferase
MRAMEEYALIVAGGSGTRMKSKVAKQFLPLAGRPVLMHTIEAFKDYSPGITIVVVLPQNEEDHWKILCETHSFSIPHELAHGGATRFQSVKNGLTKIPSPGLVAIHDGVRPLIDKNTIDASFRIAINHGTAVAAVRLKESLRVIDRNTTKAVDRSGYRLIQTPQTFKVDLIKKAYQCNDDPILTDDASVAENAGHQISLFKGTYRNIKITTPEDLIIAEALIQQKNQENL